MQDKQEAGKSILSYLIGFTGLHVSDIDWAAVHQFGALIVGVMSGLIVAMRFVHDVIYYGRKIRKWLHSRKG